MSDKMYDVLTDNALNNDMVTKGLKRAKLFNWDESSQKTQRKYTFHYLIKNTPP